MDDGDGIGVAVGFVVGEAVGAGDPLGFAVGVDDAAADGAGDVDADGTALAIGSVDGVADVDGETAGCGVPGCNVTLGVPHPATSRQRPNA